jgi:hypothetical protein
MPVVGSPEDLALSGWDAAPEDGPVFALGAAEAGRADVRFASSGDGRLIAPTGERLWRRAPWPANDALFELPPAEDSGAVLVVGSSEAADEVADRLRADGAAVATADRLTVDDLRGAAVVVLGGTGGALPAHAPCVLAARRVLVTDATEITFGLQSGIDFLGAQSPDAAAERANTARLHPRAMASLRAMGARAAREHRAAVVYPRLIADLP